MRPNNPHATFLRPKAAAPTNTTAPTRGHGRSHTGENHIISFDWAKMPFDNTRTRQCVHFLAPAPG
jgi:hypothetical protein